MYFQTVESFGTGKFYKDPEEGGPPLIFQPAVDPLPTASVFEDGEAAVPHKGTLINDIYKVFVFYPLALTLLYETY